MKYNRIIFDMIYVFHPLIGFGASVKIMLKYQNHWAIACYHRKRGWWV